MNAQLSAGALVSSTLADPSSQSPATRQALATQALATQTLATQSKTASVSQHASVSHIDDANNGVVAVRLFIRSDQVYCALLNPDRSSDRSSDNASGNTSNQAQGSNTAAIKPQASAQTQSSTGAEISRTGPASAMRHAVANRESGKSSEWNEYHIGIDVKRDMRFKLKSLTFQQAYHAGETDSIDAFGRFLRLRLGKFKGLRREKFYFHLKESEYRYNHRRYELYALLLGMLGESPIE